MRPLTFRYRFEAGAFDAARPAFAVPGTCRHNPAGLRGQLRRAAFGASAPASDAPESKGSKVVSGGPRNPHPGASRTLRQPCPAGLSRPTRSLRSHAGTSPAPVGRRGFGTIGICDAADRLPLGRPAGKRTPGHKQKEGGAGYGG